MIGFESGPRHRGYDFRAPRNYKVVFFYDGESSAIGTVSDGRGTNFTSYGMTRTYRNPDTDRYETMTFRIGPGKHKHSPRGSASISCSHAVHQSRTREPCDFDGIEFKLNDDTFCNIGDFRIVHADDPDNSKLREVEVKPAKKGTKKR